jgi:hypothetical protein
LAIQNHSPSKSLPGKRQSTVIEKSFIPDSN